MTYPKELADWKIEFSSRLLNRGRMFTTQVVTKRDEEMQRRCEEWEKNHAA